jgi:hypothetical protein
MIAANAYQYAIVKPAWPEIILTCAVMLLAVCVVLMVKMKK